MRASVSFNGTFLGKRKSTIHDANLLASETRPRTLFHG